MEENVQQRGTVLTYYFDNIRKLLSTNKQKVINATGFHVYNSDENVGALIFIAPLMPDDQEGGEGGMWLCRFLTPLFVLPSLKAVPESGLEPYARSKYRRVRCIMISHGGKEERDDQHAAKAPCTLPSSERSPTYWEIYQGVAHIPSDRVQYVQSLNT